MRTKDRKLLHDNRCFTIFMDILIIPCFLFLFYYDLLLLNFPLFSNYPIFPQLGEKISLKFTINIYNISYLTFFTQNLKKKKRARLVHYPLSLSTSILRFFSAPKKKKKETKPRKENPFSFLPRELYGRK